MTTAARTQEPNTSPAASEARSSSPRKASGDASPACKPCQDWGTDENDHPCRFCKPVKWLAWRIQVDPRIVLRRPDGKLVIPIQPPEFLSCAHPVDGCSTAVGTVEYGRPPGALAYAYSLCDLEAVDDPPPPPNGESLRAEARDAYVTLMTHARYCTDCKVNGFNRPVVNRACETGTGLSARYLSAYERWYPWAALGDRITGPQAGG